MFPRPDPCPHVDTSPAVPPASFQPFGPVCPTLPPALGTEHISPLQPSLLGPSVVEMWLRAGLALHPSHAPGRPHGWAW